MANRQKWTLECYSKDDNNKKASVIIPVTFTKVCDYKTTGYEQKKVTLNPETYIVSEAPITVDIPVWTLKHATTVNNCNYPSATELRMRYRHKLESAWFPAVTAQVVPGVTIDSDTRKITI